MSSTSSKKKGSSVSSFDISSIGAAMPTSLPQTSFQSAVEPMKVFAQDSMRLIKRCTKPDAKEFKKIALATTVGFLVMGFLGFLVKLVHIPSQTLKQAINNIIVGQ